MPSKYSLPGTLFQYSLWRIHAVAGLLYAPHDVCHALYRYYRVEPARGQPVRRLVHVLREPFAGPARNFGLVYLSPVVERPVCVAPENFPKDQFLFSFRQIVSVGKGPDIEMHQDLAHVKNKTLYQCVLLPGKNVYGSVVSFFLLKILSKRSLRFFLASSLSDRSLAPTP